MDMIKLGEGHIGGKASGLGFMCEVFQDIDFEAQFPGVEISVLGGFVVATSFYESFIIGNFGSFTGALESLSALSDRQILDKFLTLELPEGLAEALATVLEQSSAPLAVRSSSRLEDDREHPFAGIYSTYMIPRPSDGAMELLGNAVKSVWASTFFEAARSYCEATGNSPSDERMAVLIQEVVGSQEDGLWMPTLSGVARSLNMYPLGHEKPEDGVCNIVMGLGKAVVDGGKTLRFCPRYPKNVLQTSTLELTMSEAQSEVLALSLDPSKPIFEEDDAANLERLSVSRVAKMRGARHCCSYYDYQNGRISEGPTFGPSYRVITFNRMLKYDSFPLAKIVSTLLELAQGRLQCPVEMEFAVNMDVPFGKKPQFRLLQTRPAARLAEIGDFDWDALDKSKAVIYSENAIGQGRMEGIRDVVCMDFDKFSSLITRDMAEDLGNVNREMAASGRNYVLMGTGRWGTSDPNLGVPVKWSHISQARVIVEAALPGYMVETSQGTHFFQNVTSLGVGYMSVNQHLGSGIANLGLLEPFLEKETEFFKIYHLPEPLGIFVDPISRRGVVSIGAD